MKEKKLKTNCLKIAYTLIFIAVIGLIFKTLTPNVKAEANRIKVSPGAETLKKAVEAANPGDTLVLTAGSYSGGGTDKTVYINKELTIEGEKSGPSKTIIDVPIVVRTPDKVVISNFTTTPIMVEPNFVFLKTEGRVNLDINNVYIFGILRGSSNTLPRHDAMALEITNDVTGKNDAATESNHSVINVTNCNFVKPGVHYGIYSNVSNTTLNIKDSTIAGRTPVMFDSGSNNIINILEATEIDGPDAIYNESETFVIKGQNNLTVNVDNSTIKSTAPSGNVPTKTFSFSEDGAKSTNTTINIKNNSKIIDEDDERKPATNSVLFSFRNDATSADKNIVNIDKTSSMYISKKSNSYTEIATETVPLAREYNILENASVVRISDSENNSIIKVYDNNSEIAELTQEKYTKKDNYNFKGWFQDFDGTNYTNEYAKVSGNYPNTVAQKNIDLYPKFVKVLKVTITDGTTNHTYSVEEGTTLAESEDFTKIKADLDKIKEKEGQVFKGFIIYNSNGHFEPESEEYLLNQLTITEDCRIEAIHQVRVTINGNEFFTDAGKTLKDISDADNDAYIKAKQNNDEREFSRFVKKGTTETFTEEQGITANLDLESKFFCKVTIGTNTYKLEEDSILNSSEEIKTALAAISEKVSGRKFARFIDEKGNEIKPEADKITKDVTIASVYSITVKLVGKDNKTIKTYTIDADSNLSSLKIDSEIKAALEEVANSRDDGKEFDGFIITYDNETLTFDETSDKNKEKLIEDILDQNLKYNATIYVKQNIEITINSEVFEMDSGQSLKIAILDSNDETLKQNYKDAKFGGKEEKRFYKFIDESTKKEVTEEDIFEKSTTLIPKYLVFVTIDDDRTNVAGTYRLEEGKTIDDLIDKEAQDALAILRTDIDTETEDLHFEKLVTSSNEEIDGNTIIDKDITIKGLYHYDVTIVEDYDDPTYDTSASHVKGLKVYKGKNLSTIKKKVEEALDTLKQSVNKNDKRKFYSFLEVNTNKEYTDDNINELFSEVFNKHIYISAKLYHKVKIGNTEDYVLEGTTLKGNDNLVAALNNLKNTPNKEIAKLIVNGKEYSQDEITEDMEINEYTEISAEYNVNVSINGQTFTVKEGGKLSDLTAEEASKVSAALDELQKQVEDAGYNFKGYVDSNNNEFTKDTKVFENTTVSAKYNIKVTIKGPVEKPFELEINQTLKNIKDQENYKATITKANRQFSGNFRNQDGEIINESTIFTKNATLTPIFNVKVTIKEKDYYLEENTKLGTPEIIEALKAFESTEKQLTGYVYGSSKTPITTESLVTDNITIEPVYSVKLTIMYGEEVIGEFDLDENSTIKNSNKESEIEQALNILQNRVTDDGYNFKGYIADKKDFTIDTKVTKNITITAKYNIKVTIKGPVEKPFELEINQTLKNIKDQENYKATITKANRQFSGNFRNQDGEIINESTIFTKNATLTPIFNVKVTIKEKDYYLEENTKLGTPEIIEALKAFESTEKQLTGYVYGSSKTPITTESLVTDNITIEPVYSVKLTIMYGDEVIGEFALDENSTIENSSKKSEIEQALSVLKDRVTSDGYNFKGWIADKKDFTTDTKLTKNTTVTASYNIKITIQGATNSKDFEVEAGSTLSDVKDSNKSDYQEVQKKENRKFLHFLVEDGTNTILKNDDNKHQFYKNTNLKAIYATTVTINDEKYYLEENKALSSSDEIVKALQKLEKTEKRLFEFVDSNNNLLATVQQLLDKTDNPINENVTIVPKYVIDIEIEADDVFKTTVPENTKLKDIGYEKPERFNRFVDATTNETVTEDTVLKKHTKLKVIRNVFVTINGNKYELESYKKFGDLEGADKDLEALKKVPATKKNFSHFIYLDNDKEISLNKDTIISKDITVLPKYTIELSFIYEDENKQEEIIKLELEEGKAIGDLDSESLKTLNAKLREIEKLLENEGNYSFKFSKFLQADNTEVDIQKTQFNENAVVKAIFEYKENPSPVVPTNPDDDNKDTTEDEPIEVPAPNTAVEDNWNLNDIFLSIIIVVLTCGSCLGCLKCAIKR